MKAHVFSVLTLPMPITRWSNKDTFDMDDFQCANSSAKGIIVRWSRTATTATYGLVDTWAYVIGCAFDSLTSNRDGRHLSVHSVGPCRSSRQFVHTLLFSEFPTTGEADVSRDMLIHFWQRLLYSFEGILVWNRAALFSRNMKKISIRLPQGYDSQSGRTKFAFVCATS